MQCENQIYCMSGDPLDKVVFSMTTGFARELLLSTTCPSCLSQSAYAIATADMQQSQQRNQQYQQL